MTKKHFVRSIFQIDFLCILSSPVFLLKQILFVRFVNSEFKLQSKVVRYLWMWTSLRSALLSNIISPTFEIFWQVQKKIKLTRFKNLLPTERQKTVDSATKKEAIIFYSSPGFVHLLLFLSQSHHHCLIFKIRMRPIEKKTYSWIKKRFMNKITEKPLIWWFQEQFGCEESDSMSL